MKVIVCGGRNFDNKEFVFQQLDKLHAATPIEWVIEGGAKGADALAMQWAGSRQVGWTEIKAYWKKDGRAAGPIRNAEMLKHEPDLVVAFPGGPGTANMIKQAKAAGVKVLELNP